MRSLKIVGVLILMACGGVALRAQIGVPVTFTVRGTVNPELDPNEEGDIEISATLEPSSPLANDAFRSDSFGGNSAGNDVHATLSRRYIRPGKAYELLAGC
jgi:hypothetical protein